MKGNGRPLKGLFDLGQILSTPGALDALRPYPGLSRKLLARPYGPARHVSGDWGDVDAEDAAENELSVKEGFRILSAYTTPDGTRIWVITEADRSATTLLLPEEY